MQMQSRKLGEHNDLKGKNPQTLRFCMDYWGLNSVTKPNCFSLPRIDNMLDQLGEAQYFTTLDLAVGYWQVRITNVSREKVAFMTQQGLFQI